MDTATVVEIVQTEVPAAAKQVADEIFEGLGRQLNEDLTDRVNGWFAANNLDFDTDRDAFRQLATDVIHPAFAKWVAHFLTVQLREAERGWDYLLWTNLKEKYQAAP